MVTRIKIERENKSLSQIQLAQMLGVSKQSVCDWEKGRHIPDYSKLKKLSMILGKSIDYLLEQAADEQKY